MRTRTLTDLELAKVYFVLLVELAKTEPGQTIEYGQLVCRAKKRFPNNQYVNSAIATSIGRRLDALRAFTNSKKLPDLSALAVKRQRVPNDKVRNGKAYERVFDGAAVRRQIAAYNWESVQVDFDEYINNEIVRIQKIEMPEQKDSVNQ